MNLGQLLGPFSRGLARPSRVGGVEISQGSPATLEDEYTVLLDAGVRPSATTVKGVPVIGDRHTSVPGMIATRIRWQQRDASSNAWTATVTFSRGEAEYGASGPMDFEKRWLIRSMSADFTMDANTAEPVANSAGEPFDSVPQRETLLPSLSWRRIWNKPPASLWSLNGTVNKSTVTVLGITFQPHCARIRFEAAETDDSSSGKYEYRFTVEGATTMHCENSVGTPSNIGWDASFLDCGFSWLDRSGGDPPVRRPILVEDENGNLCRPSMPQPLCAGDYLATRGTYYYLKFAVYPEAEWGVLSLPRK